MHEKSETLIHRLIDKTQNQELQWRETSRLAQYILTLSHNTILIERSSTSVSVRYKFTILDENDVEIDTISKSVSSSDSDLELIRRLYEIARRSARHIDQAIDNILSELG